MPAHLLLGAVAWTQGKQASVATNPGTPTSCDNRRHITTWSTLQPTSKVDVAWSQFGTVLPMFMALPGVLLRRVQWVLAAATRDQTSRRGPVPAAAAAGCLSMWVTSASANSALHVMPCLTTTRLLLADDRRRGAAEMLGLSA